MILVMAHGRYSFTLVFILQGRCRWRNLYNIDQKDVIRESQRNVVANDRFSSTVIFVGAGPPNEDGIPSKLIIIVILSCMVYA